MELGTSIGLSAMYMAFASKKAQVHTIEGCPQTAQIAMHNFNIMTLDNIKTHVGTFEEVLPPLLPTIAPLDMVYIDGNHQLQATLDYFQLCVPYMNENTVVVLDDILEEIVGQFTSSQGETIDEIKVQNDGSYLIDPRISIRELNTELKVKLPFDNAKTLNGLILEQLQSFPKHNVSLKVDNLIIEIIQVSKQGIKLVRITKN